MAFLIFTFCFFLQIIDETHNLSSSSNVVADHAEDAEDTEDSVSALSEPSPKVCGRQESRGRGRGNKQGDQIVFEKMSKMWPSPFFVKINAWLFNRGKSAILDTSENFKRLGFSNCPKNYPNLITLAIKPYFLNSFS
jgi:hypothetical protein